MGSDLRDLRAKITDLTWTFLEAESRTTGEDHSAIVRQILDRWAHKRLRYHIEAKKLLKSTGNDKEDGGLTPIVRGDDYGI